MADTYAAALKALPANVAAVQQAFQRGWIKGRDDCGKAADARACVEESYRTRIVDLQIRSGQFVAPPPVLFACMGVDDVKSLWAVFYKETDPPSAVLTYGGDRVIAFQAPSGSGARYEADNVEFWEHHGEATLHWFGKKLACRPGPAGAAGPQAGRQSLRGTSWVLVEFLSSDDTRLEPAVNTRYALTFNADGSLQVQSDCNRGRGTWRSSDDVSLEIGAVALTRAHCPPSPLQQRFARDLGYVRSYVVRDGKLYLSLMADGGIYAFDPAR